MKKFEVTMIKTGLNKVIEARSAEEAKDIFRKELISKGALPGFKLKAEELQGFFA